MNADFVIISYECNFWALAAVDALVDAMERAAIDRNIHVIHNLKSTRQINHFKDCCRRSRRPDAVQHIVAYEGLFEQVGNYADFEREWDHIFLASHSFVLNWLIKYRLQPGRYFFIDHDCIVRPDFVRALLEDFNDIDGKLLVFPRHFGDPKSLTAPMFYCDTEIRDYLGGLCDLGWIRNIVRGQRDTLRGGREAFYTDAEIERVISRKNFDDTLHNVLRHLLARWPALVNRFATRPWRECDHIWHAATRRLTGAPLELLKNLLATRFRPNFFLLDEHTDLYQCLLQRLRECGLGREFATRILGSASGESEARRIEPQVTKGS